MANRKNSSSSPPLTPSSPLTSFLSSHAKPPLPPLRPSQRPRISMLPENPFPNPPPHLQSLNPNLPHTLHPLLSSQLPLLPSCPPPNLPNPSNPTPPNSPTSNQNTQTHPEFSLVVIPLVWPTPPNLDTDNRAPPIDSREFALNNLYNSCLENQSATTSMMSVALASLPLNPPSPIQNLLHQQNSPHLRDETSFSPTNHKLSHSTNQRNHLQLTRKPKHLRGPFYPQTFSRAGRVIQMLSLSLESATLNYQANIIPTSFLGFSPLEPQPSHPFELPSSSRNSHISPFMIILAWNVCGAGGTDFKRIFRDLVNLHHPSNVILIETRLSAARADSIIPTLGFDSFVKVDAMGFAGGIWVMWHSHLINITTLGSSFQEIHYLLKDILLFSKASVANSLTIKDILTDFSNASGLEINLSKSKLWFSPSTPASNKLSSWKTNLLSFSGRLQLIKSTTSALHSHIMQAIFLPLNIHNKIDKINRNFLWGHSHDTRKLHYVNWNTITQPKTLGGLAKYGQNLERNIHSKSYVRRSLDKGLSVFNLGLAWRIGNGLPINFWYDKWLPSGPIRSSISGPLSFDDSLMSVSSVLSNGSFDISIIFKLNIDSSGVDGKLGAGGVIRNVDGCFIAGFCKFIGSGSALQAEFWALQMGLQFAIDQGIKNLEIETDAISLTIHVHESASLKHWILLLGLHSGLFVEVGDEIWEHHLCSFSFIHGYFFDGGKDDILQSYRLLLDQEVEQVSLGWSDVTRVG
ncbi:reverse transcriptase [Senna tora]|uniref:Reverse transcriptase n=1 Tax=Senna tora TaxID=362788 RepID=A0A834W3J5_9FABA|nr:reverse transcriptase [Senna tora]